MMVMMLLITAILSRQEVVFLTMYITRIQSLMTTVSTTPTIDYLVANLQQPAIVQLLQNKDPNAVRLLRGIQAEPWVVQKVTKDVIIELGLGVDTDDRAIAVLQEIHD